MLSALPASPKRPAPPGRLSYGGKRGIRSGAVAASAVDTPPPPYDGTSSLRQLHDVFGDSDTSPVTTLLGSSVVATAKVLGYELPTTDSGLDEAALQKKSREELFDLLKNAEAVIRTHETELNLAALAGEALLRENDHLRTRHDSLLARVKPGQYDSLRAPGLRANTSFEQHVVPSGPPTPAADPPPGLPPVPVTPPQRLHPLQHRRGLSASPEQIAQLNSQNDELHSRLEKIISEANQTDREAKRHLRQLQKEIEGLSHELEATQRRNTELEVQAAEVIRRTREDREEELVLARVRARHDTEDDQLEEHLKDFAPSGVLPSSSSLSSLNSTPRRPPDVNVPFPSRTLSAELEVMPSFSEEPEEEDDVFGPVRRRSRLTSCTPEEFTLLTQILSKVKELEDANNTISASQKDMRDKLELARREATEIKHKYDGLQLDELEGIDSNGDTVRFLSLRSAGSSTRPPYRRVTSPATSPYDDHGLPDSPVLTTRDANPLFNLTKPRKYRRPLNQLFATSLDDLSSSREDNERTIRPSPTRKVPRTPPPSLQSTVHSNIHITAASPPEVGQDESTANTSVRADLLSPSPSFLGLSIPTSLSGLMRSVSSSSTVRTLEQELGADFGEEWQTPNPNADIFDESFGISASTSMASAGPFSELGEREHPAMAALRDALHPGNAGRMLEPGEHILPEGSLAGAPGEAFSLLGRAVVARPNRWIARADGQPLLTAGPPRFRPRARTTDEDPWETTRYPEDEAFYRQEDVADELPPLSATSGKWSRRNSALGRLSSTRRRRLTTSDSQDKSGEIAIVEDVNPSEPESKLTVREKMQAKGIEIVLELWLFLQFVVVIGVFVFVMARKGPRAVLGDPVVGRRR